MTKSKQPIFVIEVSKLKEILRHMWAFRCPDTFPVWWGYAHREDFLRLLDLPQRVPGYIDVSQVTGAIYKMRTAKLHKNANWDLNNLISRIRYDRVDVFKLPNVR